jgi:hypothetical protein
MKHALALGISVLCWPALALAQSGPPVAGVEPVAPSPAGVHLVDDAEPEPPLVPRAKDLLGGHVLLGASVGPAWSLGKLGSDVAAVRGVGTGLALEADAGFGVSRSVALGVWGNYARYGDGDSCSSLRADDTTASDCSGYSFSVGPFVRYHLSQGLRFDPWLLVGAGFRRLRFNETRASGTASSPVVSRQTYSGLSWLRLELGADYYLWSGLGFGPYGALSLSSYTKRPQDAGGASVNTELSVGLRLLFDFPGR